jgi:hypothetical protein
VSEPVAGPGLPPADVTAVDAAVLRATGTDDVGVTDGGFVPKPFARILAEKLALARGVLGEDVDLTSSSVLRKLLEISALEDARTWAALGGMYDNSFVVSATGEALSALGAELGLPRPFLEATGWVTLQLSGTLPAGVGSVRFPLGARMLTPGGHDVATAEEAVLSATQPKADIAVVAFQPGERGNLKPGTTAADGTHLQRIDAWNLLDPALADYAALVERTRAEGSPVEVTITHTAELTGGQQRWPDDRYRSLLLRAPRSIWSAQAVQVAVSLVPGVRQVQVRDQLGGLDLNQSVFGTLNFLDGVFSAERDITNPFSLTVLVAPTPGAVWEGPGGLRESVLAAMENIRPLGIFPAVERGDTVSVSFAADVLVGGVPLPPGSRDAIGGSPAAVQLKRSMSEQVRAYVMGLSFGEPVRAAEVTYALMSVPGVQDVRGLELLRWPGPPDETGLPGAIQRLGAGQNVTVGPTSIPSYVEQLDGMRIVTR